MRPAEISDPADRAREHLAAVANYAAAGASMAGANDATGIVFAIQQIVVHLRAASLAVNVLLDAAPTDRRAAA